MLLAEDGAAPGGELELPPGACALAFRSLLSCSRCLATGGPVGAGDVEVGVVACGLVVVVVGFGGGCGVVDVEVVEGFSSMLSSRELDPDAGEEPEGDAGEEPEGDAVEEPEEDGSLTVTGTEVARAPAGRATSSDSVHRTPPASRGRDARRTLPRGHERLNSGMSGV